MQSSLPENYSNQTYLFRALRLVSYQVSTICVQNLQVVFAHIRTHTDKLHARSYM